MGGINANGARISTPQRWAIRVRAVYYSSEASVNVLCMSDIVDRAPRSPTSTTLSEVIMANGGPTSSDRWADYACATCQSTRLHGLSSRASATAAPRPHLRSTRGPAEPRHRAGISRTHPGAVDNVAGADSAARYTKREMAATNEARDLMTRFKGVPSADIIKMMRDGHRAPPCCHRISPGPWTSGTAHR
jgi:hypothetical protein